MRSQNQELKKGIYDFVNAWKRKHVGLRQLREIADEMN